MRLCGSCAAWNCRTVGCSAVPEDDEGGAGGEAEQWEDGDGVGCRAGDECLLVDLVCLEECCDGVVDSVTDDGNPNVSAVDERVSEHSADDGSWDYAVELEVEKAENESGNPNGDVRRANALSDESLERAAEEEFFADSGQNAHCEDCDCEAGHGVRGE